jgi:hypothetical protein
MSLSDPQSITISAVATSLPRVSTGANSADYLSSDSLFKLSLSSAYGRRTRRVIRFDHSKISADPFLPAQNVKVGMSVYTVFDLPPAGYTNAEALAIFAGFNTLETASSNAVISKLLGGES